MTKPKLYASIEAFRQAGKDGGQLEAEASVRASFDTTVKAEEGDSRKLTFTISTESVDRMGDTISVDGWQLDNYKKNPVVLWAHDSWSRPVGKAPKVWTEKASLKAEAEFTPLGMIEFNDTVFEMYKQGFLSATSVGFQPIKYAFVDDPNRKWGIDFMEQELLEFSCVPVPANPEALVEGKAAGLEVDLLLDWAESTMKRAGDADRVRKLADQVLGADDQSEANLAWARRIAAKAGLGLFPQERIDTIERTAKAQRLAQKRARDLDLIRARG